MSRAFVAIAAPRSGERLEGALRKILWGSVIVLVFCAAGLLVFYLFISPNLLIQKIDIRSDLPLTRDEILALAQLGGREYFFAIDVKVLEARLKAHPRVKDAGGEKVFPETLKLTLYGRRSLFLGYSRSGSRALPVVFDEEGVLFERGATLSERNLPVLSGFSLEENASGARLNRAWRPFLKDMGELKKNDVQLFNLISEIRVVSASSGSYELVLYPISWPVRVWIGKRVNAGMLRYMFHTLYFMQREGILREVDEVDFRSGEAVYRRKGVEDIGAR